MPTDENSSCHGCFEVLAQLGFIYLDPIGRDYESQEGDLMGEKGTLLKVAI